LNLPELIVDRQDDLQLEQEGSEEVEPIIIKEENLNQGVGRAHKKLGSLKI
jgi:hypothetical protein